MELLRWDGHFTGTLAPLESMSCLHSVPYHHQVITSSRSIMGGAAPVYSEKINQEVLTGLSCQASPIYEYLVLPNFMKNFLLIVRFILWKFSKEKVE